MERLTSEMERIQWRKDKVQKLSTKGHSYTEIASILRVAVDRHLTYIRQQAKNNIKKYIDDRLPEEYEKCMVGFNSILREAWATSEHTEDRREKIQALSLAKECYGMKFELLTNATVVDDAIRFVTEHGKSITTVSATTRALKPKIDTVEDIKDAEHTPSSPSTTINQVF